MKSHLQMQFVHCFNLYEIEILNTYILLKYRDYFGGKNKRLHVVEVVLVTAPQSAVQSELLK